MYMYMYMYGDVEGCYGVFREIQGTHMSNIVFCKTIQTPRASRDILERFNFGTSSAAQRSEAALIDLFGHSKKQLEVVSSVCCLGQTCGGFGTSWNALDRTQRSRACLDVIPRIRKFEKPYEVLRSFLPSRASRSLLRQVYVGGSWGALGRSWGALGRS